MIARFLTTRLSGPLMQIKYLGWRMSYQLRADRRWTARWENCFALSE